MADVTESIGDRALKEFLGSGVKRFAGGQVVVELFYGREEALDFGGPRLRLGVAPGLLALGHGESPIEEVADVGQDFGGDSD